MPGETVLVIDDSPTILKVVQLVLSKAGYRVETAADGEAGLELARTAQPTLILLDFVMPRMNGYQFCRELAARQELREIPVVLMSAKGDQVGERFVKVMGIVDYVTKPFPPEVITDVVRRAIASHGPPADGASVTEGAPGAGGDAAEDTARRAQEARGRALGEARARIVALLAGRDPGLGPLAGEALGDDELAAIVRDAAAAMAPADPAPALLGELGAVPLAAVLRLVDGAEQTGVLAVTGDGGSARIHVRKGRVEQALAEGVAEELRLGRFLVAGEAVSADALEALVAARPEGAGGLIGRYLVDQGAIDEAGLRAALSAQTAEIVYEAMRWRAGTFAFTSARDIDPPAADAALGLDVEALLMAGFHRADEWHVIERDVSDFDMVFLRDEEAAERAGAGQLTRDEQTILELVNGKNTVQDIIRRSRMSSLEVSKLLSRLVAGRLIRRRIMPVAV